MNLSEAYKIFEIPETSTEDEAKKQYRKLSKKYHPDINKEAGAEEKFKKINEAYECIKSGKGNDPEPEFNPFGGGFNPFNFGGFGFNRQQVQEPKNINLSTAISFKDSVLGTKKDIKYSRNIKCNTCNGQGHKIIDNGCKTCGGKGKIVTKQGNMLTVQQCNACNGKSVAQKCSDCSSNGFKMTQSSVSVTIPAGVEDNDILRLGGMGNYTTGMFEGYTDIHLKINVEKDKNLVLLGNDVISNVNISLLEALKGTKTTVPTVFGEKTIEIPALTKNLDEIYLNNLGVPKVGKQIVKVKVSYPNDVSKLINSLENNE